AEFRVERPVIVIDHATAVIGIEGLPIGVTTLQPGGAVEMVPVDRRLVSVTMMGPAAGAEVGDGMARRQALAGGRRSRLGRRQLDRGQRQCDNRSRQSSAADVKKRIFSGKHFNILRDNPAGQACHSQPPASCRVPLFANASATMGGRQTAASFLSLDGPAWPDPSTTGNPSGFDKRKQTAYVSCWDRTARL